MFLEQLIFQRWESISTYEERNKLWVKAITSNIHKNIYTAPSGHSCSFQIIHTCTFFFNFLRKTKILYSRNIEMELWCRHSKSYRKHNHYFGKKNLKELLCPWPRRKTKHHAHTIHARTTAIIEPFPWGHFCFVCWGLLNSLIF